jgi:hypothetical protein
MNCDDAQLFRETLMRILRLKFVNSSPFLGARQPPHEPSYVGSIRSYSSCDLSRMDAMLIEGKTINEVFQAFPFPIKPNHSRLCVIESETAGPEVVMHAAFFECLAWVCRPCCDSVSFSALLKLLTKCASLDRRDEMTFIVSLLVRKDLDGQLELTWEVITEITDHIVWNSFLTEMFSGVFIRFVTEVMDVHDRRGFLKVYVCFVSEGRTFFDLLTDMLVQLSLPAFRLDQHTIGFLCPATRSSRSSRR